MSVTVITEENVLVLDTASVSAVSTGPDNQISIVESPSQVTVVSTLDSAAIAPGIETVTLVLQDTAPISITDTPSLITIASSEEKTSLTIDERSVLIEDSKSGLQGPAGPKGSTSIYVQPTQPVAAPAPYLWIQTGLGALGDDWTTWFEDGI